MLSRTFLNPDVVVFKTPIKNLNSREVPNYDDSLDIAGLLNSSISKNEFERIVILYVNEENIKVREILRNGDSLSDYRDLATHLSEVHNIREKLRFTK